ncbi:MAG: S9 family peptidase [Alphaproteobacteria bacterium]|nr:S9 family peptidase [Alphaproteobacteria bacterium]
MAQHYRYEAMMKKPNPPRAAKKPYRQTHHSFTREDEYAWLRDENWQTIMKEPHCLRADIRRYLQAENAYCEAIISQTGELPELLFAEMQARIKEDERTPPMPNKQWAWAWHYQQGAEHPQICRSQRDGTKPQIVLDCNKEADNETYFKLINHCPTPAQDLLAWAVDRQGSEHCTIYMRDIASQKDNLPDRLENASGSMAWAADGQYIFYVLLDDQHRPNRVMCHRLGTMQSADRLVFEEKDAGFFVSLSASRSGDIIFIDCYNHETSEIWVIDAYKPEAAPQLIAPRLKGVEYTATYDAARKRLILLTNKDGAVDYKLMQATLNEPTNWQEFIPHKAGCLLLDVAAFENHLVWLARENALPALYIQSVKTGDIKQIAFEEEAYELTLEAGFEYDTNICRFSYASMTRPEQIFDYNMETDVRQLVHEQIVPSGHEPNNYITRRLWAEAKDGAKIPLSLLYHKDTPLDGTAPALLYGYGAYGTIIAADFSTTRLSLVDRGFIYAIAHIRGGKAMGHNWFLQGRGKKKQNSFTDFIAAAHALIDNGLTQKKQITIHGGSAGGLLVGAALNFAPDLFCGAVAEVPFVDILATMLDDTLPLTPPEWPEWGNPIKNADDYETIAAYAPYENIAACAYPHILATAGLTDPRVTYWEPAKWVARLRERRTDDGLTLLKTNMQAGHGGKAGRFNRLREIALIYTFILYIHNKHIDNKHIDNKHIDNKHIHNK